MQTGGRVRCRTIRSRTITPRHRGSRQPPQGPAWPWGNYLRDVGVFPLCRQGYFYYCRLRAGIPYIYTGGTASLHRYFTTPLNNYSIAPLSAPGQTGCVTPRVTIVARSCNDTRSPRQRHPLLRTTTTILPTRVTITHKYKHIKGPIVTCLQCDVYKFSILFSSSEVMGSFITSYSFLVSFSLFKSHFNFTTFSILLPLNVQ